MTTVLEKLNTIHVFPLEPTIGAEIEGVDLSQPISDAVCDQIKQAILDYKVVFFRDQTITREQHRDFAARFGDLYSHPSTPHFAEFPEIHRIAAEDFKKHSTPERGYKGPAVWHTDTSWRLLPTWGVVLHGVHIPDVEGDTLWVDAGKAYDNLSTELQERLENLYVTHDFRDSLRKAGKDYPIVAHPIIRTHPETGKKILWVNFSLKPQILGLDLAECAELLRIIHAEYQRPEYQVRFKWRQGSVAFWDNRAAVHFAVHDYGDFPRVVERILIKDQADYVDY
jgi:alpha-ketoglutarate-dependent taurine dioxygenase